MKDQKMLNPIIAIVGRPNVGKSTLFNCLTKTRQALVADMPGSTRDRLCAKGMVGDYPYEIVDTGGLKTPENGIEELSITQLQQAIEEADAILFVVDGRAGLTPLDSEIAQMLRLKNKTVALVVNKTDGIDPDVAQSEFYTLGFEHIYPIAASHNRGVTALMEEFQIDCPSLFVQEGEGFEEEALEENRALKMAIIGRPNVGKSTLTNRLLKADRVIVFDEPGTTRDSIYIQMTHHNRPYVIIDTAGVRRKSRIHETIEKFSVIKSLQAIKDANVVVLMLNGQEDVVDQDLRLLEMILQTGRAVVVVINKWDGLESTQKEDIRKKIGYKFNFAPNLKFHYISALHGTGVGDIFDLVQEAYLSSTQEMSANKLTKILEEAVASHPPPSSHGGRIKLRYAHCGGHNPPVIVIHGNQTDSLPEHYKRYLNNTFSKALRLVGTPLKIQYRTAENPFAGKRNTLTPRQIFKRKRLMSHVKSKGG